MNNMYKNICEVCGDEFLTGDKDEHIWLPCRITRDMKLPPDTIINQNVLNIYLNGAFDKAHGVDKTYLTVAEGVKLFKRKRKKEQLCSTATFLGQKSNDEIDKYVNMLDISSTYKLKYDAMVMVKISSTSDFMIFGLSYSDRLAKKIKDKPILFKKNFAISLAIKYFYRNVNK